MREIWTSSTRGGRRAVGFHGALGALFAVGAMVASGCADEDPGTGTDDSMSTAGSGAAGSGGVGGVGGFGGVGRPGGEGGAGGAGGLGGTGGGQAGVGGQGGDGGQGGVGGSMEGDASVGNGDPDAGMMNDPEPREDLGEGDGQDVITIGDSYMNFLTDGIAMALEDVSGRDYRNYGFPGTLVTNEQIPDQYTSAVEEEPDIKTVVMTGGGNDVLNDGCSGTDCNSVVDDVTVRLDELRAQMAEDGVQDVIIVGYGYPDDESLHASLDYSREQTRMNCNIDDTPRCHYIDPAEELMGMIGDGIHPTGAGYDLLGEMVWELMQEQGIRR